MSRRMDQRVSWLALLEETEPLAHLAPVSRDTAHRPAAERLAEQRATGTVLLAERYPDHRRAPRAPRVPLTRRRRHVGLAVAELLPAALVIGLAVYAVVRMLAGTGPQ